MLGTAPPHAEGSQLTAPRKTLLHVKTLSIFMRLETAGAGGEGFKSSTGWDTRRCSVPPPRRDNKTRTSGSTEGPVPGSCPRTRTPAPTRKHEQAEQISGLNFRPYPEISGFCHVNLHITRTRPRNLGEREDKGSARSSPMNMNVARDRVGGC